jgi:GNAT superfamily N-acetyltransferase
MTGDLALEKVGRDRFDEVVDVLSEAFYDYPVMRHVIGPVGRDYARRLRLLIGFFTEARFLRGDDVLAVSDQRSLVAVATIVPPHSVASDALEKHRHRLWRELGSESRERYEDFGRGTDGFFEAYSHYHLSMIGVGRGQAGRGLARRLLEALHDMSLADESSDGVTLTTENPANVSFYERFGYRIVGHANLGAFESWGFFRPDGDTTDSL